MMEGMLRTGDTSMRASTEGRSFTQENTSNIPKTATFKGGSRLKHCNVSTIPKKGAQKQAAKRAGENRVVPKSKW